MRAAVRSVLMVLAVLLARTAHAEEPDYAGMLLTNQSLLASPPRTCDAKEASLSNVELQQCAAVGLREADRAMTEAYRGAMQAGDPERNDRLKQAQRNWLAYRNLECDWESLQFKGGSFAPVAMGNCLVDVTRARAKQLRDRQND